MTAFQPQIRFAATSDGVRIAYTIVGGDGPTFVSPSGWVSHVELEWQTGPSGEFFRQLARGRRLLVYDGRGTGLSDRNVDDFSLQTRLNDLEAVVGHAGLERFTLFAWSMATPTAIAYATEHPERLDNLILYASFCRGPEGQERAIIQTLTDLIRIEWGVGARTTMGFIHPDAERHEIEESMQYFRAAASGEVAARILQESFLNTDVREYLPRITVPALVLHRRDDTAVRLEFGREVAMLLPNARFIILEGNHHPPFYGDSDAVLRAIDDFLGVEPQAAVEQPHTHTHAGAPVTILFTDIEGSTTLTQRLGDAGAQELLRAHNDIVRDALRSHGGDEIKHTGDGIMASFPSTSGALEAAIDAQRALARHNHAHPDDPVRVRMGLNMGEPVRERDDLFGQAVQLARRICDRAAPGQILASNVVRELVAGKGFLFADLGDTELRGFEDPVRLYAVRWEE